MLVFCSSHFHSVRRRIQLSQSCSESKALFSTKFVAALPALVLQTALERQRGVCTVALLFFFSGGVVEGLAAFSFFRPCSNPKPNPLNPKLHPRVIQLQPDVLSSQTTCVRDVQSAKRYLRHPLKYTCLKGKYANRRERTQTLSWTCGGDSPFQQHRQCAAIVQWRTNNRGCRRGCSHPVS